MEQLIQLALFCAILWFGLTFVLGLLLPGSTSTAIQHAFWHRIIVGSGRHKSGGSSRAGLGFFRFVILAMLLAFLISRL